MEPANTRKNPHWADWSPSASSLRNGSSEQSPQVIASHPTTNSMSGIPRYRPETELSDEERHAKKKVRFDDTPSYNYTSTPRSNRKFKYVRSTDNRSDSPLPDNLLSTSAQHATCSGSAIPSATSECNRIPSASGGSNVAAAKDSKPFLAHSAKLHTKSTATAAMGTKHVPFALDSDSDTDDDDDMEVPYPGMRCPTHLMSCPTHLMSKSLERSSSPVVEQEMGAGASFWSRKDRNYDQVNSRLLKQRSGADAKHCRAQSYRVVAPDLSQSQCGIDERAGTVSSHLMNITECNPIERHIASNNIQQSVNNAALPIAKPQADQPAKARKISVLQAQEQRRREDQRRTDEAKLRIDNARKREAEKYQAKLSKQEDEKQAAKEVEARQKQDLDAATERKAALERLTTAVKNHSGTTGSKRKAIQDTHDAVREVSSDTFVPNSKSAPAVTLSEAQKAREMRIQAKKAMNERKRAAEALDEREYYRNQARETNAAGGSQNVARIDSSLPSAKYGDCFSSNAEQSLHPGKREQTNGSHGSLRNALTPAVPQDFSGPISLNSAAGLAAVADSTIQRSSAPKAQQGSLKSSQYKSENLDVWKWRSQGMKWHEVSNNFVAKYGELKANKTLRDRYNSIRDAINTGIIDIPHGFVPAGQKDEQIHNEKFNHSQNLQPRPSALPVSEFCPTAAKKWHPPEHMAANSVDNERPQVSGKTLNASTFQYYLELLAEEGARSDASSIYDDDSESNDEDVCEFEYQVIRREITAAEIEDGMEIDEVDFDRYGPAYFSPGIANEEASKELFRLRRFRCADLSACSMQCDHNEYGLAMLQLHLPSHGIIEVTVLRVVRYSAEGVPLRANLDLAPKVVYLIKKRTTTKTGEHEELFGEISEITTESTPDNAVFTTAEMANDAAIKCFVQQTFKSLSANLSIRGAEVTEKEVDCHKKLQEQGEGALFDCIGDINTTKRVRVTVETAKLLGPRNL